MFNIDWNAFPEQITGEVNEEPNTSTMMMEVQTEEEEQEEQEGHERVEPSSATPTKSPGKKRIPASYPDEIAFKIINEWRDSPHLYKKEHEGYVLGAVVV